MERYSFTILSALGMVEKWAKRDQHALHNAYNTLSKLYNKKEITLEEHLELIDEKLNLVGAAALENNKNIFDILDTLEKRVHTMHKRLSVMGVVLALAVIAIILLVIL